MRENGHIADVIKHSIAWYETHFRPFSTRTTN